MTDPIQLIINGTDITDYLLGEENGDGYVVTKNDIDSPNAGRTMDGTMYRDRVATKDKIEVNCRLLSMEEGAILFNLIDPEFVSVTYFSPRTNSIKTGTFYVGDVPAQAVYTAEGRKWGGISFSLIEQ